MIDGVAVALAAVVERIEALERDRPDLLAQDWRFAFSRVVTHETFPSFESLVNRAAFAVLAAAGRDASDALDPTSGGEAA